MEWSSDDEDVPPFASLRLSGSTASPCFLVQDSQPSPKKPIPGSFAPGFLNGLSQVNGKFIAHSEVHLFTGCPAK